jgi:putative aldouronate transport system permease protein
VATAGAATKRRSSGLRAFNFRRNLELLTLTLPVVLTLLIFNYLPMFGIVIAFKNYKGPLGILGSPWSGLQNFQFFFRSSRVWEVTRNTILYNVVFILTTLVVSLAFALMLYELTRRTWVKFYQTVFFFPYFMSWVVVSIILYAFLNQEYGIINTLLKSLGLQPVAWYSKPEYWPFILTFMNLWKGVGYSTVVYYAGLMGVDPELFESAAIDGARRWQRTIKITIPMISPVIIILLILSMGRIFEADFGLFYQLPMQSGMLLPTTDVINYFVYRALINLQDFGMSSAVGLYQSIMGFLLVVASNAIVTRINPENRLF